MLDITSSYVCHDSFICGTWLPHIYSYVWHNSFICNLYSVDELRDAPNFIAWRDTRLCDMTQSYVCHDSLHMSAETHSYVWHDSRLRSWGISQISHGRTHVHIHALYTYVCVYTCIYLLLHSQGTGFRRLIGCLKLQVIFRKRATNYRALLRKIPCEDKTSYGSSPPCTVLINHHAHTHTHTHTHTYPTRAYIWLHVNVHTCGCVYICKSICICIHMCTYMHI